MWWQAVFWILLIPLIIVEIIIFLKSRKFFWLIYALSIFTYIVAVSYTIDVFKMGRNTIILLLLASAVLMFLIGRQLGKKVKKQKAVSGKEKYAAITLAAIMVLLFVVSVIFGRLSETITPVASIRESEMVRQYAPEGKYEPQIAEITVLERKLTNSFFLPVPIKQQRFKGCLVTDKGTFDIEPYYNYLDQNEEVAAGDTKTVKVTVQPYYESKDMPVDASSLRLYTVDDYSYTPCASLGEPDYTIPVQ